jgi:hypothetical protein
VSATTYVWFHTATAILQYDPIFGRIILGGIGIGRVGVGVARLYAILTVQVIAKVPILQCLESLKSLTF